MPVPNTMVDLNDHLFAELAAEIERAKAISSIGKTAIENARVVLDAARFQDDRLDASGGLPRMLGGAS